MSVNVTMPKLGLTMETGKITEWKKQEGEQVQEKEILLVVETKRSPTMWKPRPVEYFTSSHRWNQRFPWQN